MLLVRELEPETWPENAALESHPIVTQLFSGEAAAGGGLDYATEYPIDDHPRRHLPLIYDADSSQHSALIDVLDGHSRVIEGPPGTGKSQTITNLIAAALHEGKKVLFIAEKLAALEVVKSRLSQAGLGAFVLELHGTKANKKELLGHIRDRLDLKPGRSRDLPVTLQQAEQKHQELRAYADAMNAVLGNELGITVHQVLWRAERHRLQAGASAPEVQDLDYFLATRTSPPQFEDTRSLVRRLAQHFVHIDGYGPQHPLWGFFPSELQPEDDLAVQRLLREYEPRFAKFRDAATDLVQLLGASKLTVGKSAATRYCETLALLSPGAAGSFPHDVLPLLFTADDPDGVKAGWVLCDLQLRTEAVRAMESRIAQHLSSSTPIPPDVVASAKSLHPNLAAHGLGALKAADLETLADRLTAQAERVNRACEVFARAAHSTGITFTGEPTQATQLVRVCALATQATQEILDCRHDVISRADSPARLESLIQERDRLAAEQARLAQVFYLDEQPTEAELATAIQVLREGDAWYRLFQSRWRRAIRTHHTLAQDKTRKPSKSRLTELESLARYEKDTAKWAADPLLRTLQATLAAGEDVPLERLHKAAQWLAALRAATDAAGIREDHLDPVRVGRQLLRDIGQHHVPLRKAAQEISEALGILATDCPASRGSGSVGMGVVSVVDRLRVVDDLASTARAAAAVLRQMCRETAIASEGLQAVIASAELSVMRHEVDSHADARMLLGDHFSGVDTHLGPLLAALDYGKRVKEARLPPFLERLLLSGSCARNHEVLMRCFEGLHVGGEDRCAFATKMSQLGKFQEDLWVDETGLGIAESAKQLHDRVRRAAENLPQLLPWSQYVTAREAAVSAGLETFVDALEKKRVPGDRLESVFCYRFYATIAKAIFQASPVFRQFSGERHSAIRREYADLDRQVIQSRGMQVAAECCRRAAPPRGENGMRVSDKTEMRLLELLVNQQRPRVPVRQMLKRAGLAIQELMPCFMMGPQAVAQFLEPGYLDFDIVIMDEASQLRPEQAVGAIARGTQVVVVGDPKQLPPTSFFSRGVDGEADGVEQVAVADAESILDVCISQFRPIRTLRWHYRSRHQSLIAFSNQRFYRGNLIVFPSPHEAGRALGLRYHYIADGIYENQMNAVEAQRVVDAVVEHILTRPDDSLGVVTLNIKQRDLVAELLDARLRCVPEAIQFRERWAGEGMGLFVKNLENVQGDERDCILISTTFGKAPGVQVVRQNFGPISRDGGWRRLNVLFTRARKSVSVYSSMRPEDIVSDASTPEGTRSLRSYLEFARDGVMRNETETELPPDSDFEIAVIDVLKAKGYEVTPQLGVAGFRIDIAVKHPKAKSTYLAAIECDGATYHSGVSVRDRDRIRQDILESLGWRGRIWRIWSTDWFRSPRSEADKMFRFLEALTREPVPDEPVARRVDEGKAAHTTTNVAETGGGLLFDLDEEDLAVQVGDKVTLHPADSPDKKVCVTITENETVLGRGLVSQSDELGRALLGATVGEEVVVRNPRRSAERFVVDEIARQAPH